VAPGQLLGRLVALPGSSDDWVALPAHLVDARNRFAQAERERGRAERLVEAGAVPARRLHEARAALEHARAILRATEMRAAGVEVEQLTDDGSLSVRSPMGGIVAEVRVTDGEPVDPERALFRILDLSRLVARVEVPEPELQKLLAAQRRGIEPTLALRPATGERVDVLRPGEWISGARLLGLGVEIDAASRTAPVRYEVHGAGDRLRPGMTVVAQLQLGPQRDALALPASAILDLAGAQVVYVQLGGETFEERAVRIGTRDGDLVEILAGLAPGDRVVTVGAYPVRLAALSPDAAPAHSH
jgi:RND family efflux transporter MFP subunit